MTCLTPRCVTCKLKLLTPHFWYVVAASRKLEPKDKAVHTESQGDERPVDDGRTSVHQPRRTHREAMVQAYGEYSRALEIAF